MIAGDHQVLDLADNAHKHVRRLPGLLLESRKQKIEDALRGTARKNPNHVCAHFTHPCEMNLTFR